MPDTQTFRPASRIVGVGASAGGLEPLTSLFSGTEPDVDAAFVVVQHLSPDHPSLMAELLGRRTKLQVDAAEEGVVLRAGHVYLMPPGAEIHLLADQLTVKVGGRHQQPIDTFLVSLAKGRGGDAVAVILSGTGSDGTAGAAVVRQSGGTVLVQAPDDAQFDGMPRSVIERGLATEVHTREKLPEALARIVGSPARRSAEFEPWIEEVLSVVRDKSGLDLREYKASTFLRRLHRRMEDIKRSTPGAYLKMLREDSSEPDALLHSLLIDVTRFFRDTSAFERLRDEVLPQALKGSPSNQPFRVWCAGCASGHEAYSLAMVVQAALESGKHKRDYKIFATDASRSALDFASRGIYPEDQLSEVAPELRDRFFKKQGRYYRVNEEVRRHVIFAHHNLQTDPPFTQIDLLACRNVLIYFRAELQHRLLSLFHFALRPNGFLFLGDSETVGAAEASFERLGDPRARLYRRTGFSPGTPSMVSAIPHRQPPPSLALQKRQVVDAALRQLVQEFAPAAVVVDREGQVEHIIGDVLPFLGLPPGDLTRRLDQLARGPLGAVVATVLAQARRGAGPVSHGGTTLPGVEGFIQVTARLVPDSDRVLVTMAAQRGQERTSEPSELARMEDLHQELSYTRESLQSTIEELQTSNEELQASNEELLASNEELQATNEELHATNEELHTVTAERQERITELMTLNEDLDNLMRTTALGTVYLDADLCVRKLMGPVERFLRIRPHDVGRPISDLAHALGGTDLTAMARRVLASGESQENDEGEIDDRGVFVRALPFESALHPGGVIFHFLDITELRIAQHSLQLILDSFPQHVAVVDEAGVIEMVNKAWLAFAQQNGGHSMVGTNYIDIAHQDPRAAHIAKGLKEVLVGARDSFDEVYPCDTPEKVLRFAMHAHRLDAFGSKGMVVSHLNVTDELRASANLERLRRRYRKVFESVGEPLLVVRREDMRVMELNAQACDLFGRTRNDLVASSLSILVPEGRIGAWQQALSEPEIDGQDTTRVLEFLSTEGDDISVAVAVTSLGTVNGETHMLLKFHRFKGETYDLNSEPQKRARRLEALGNLAGGVAHEMNNVLAGIMSVAELWQGASFLDEEHQADLDDILASCRRGRDVTRNLLGFARSETRKEAVDVQTVIEQAEGFLRRAASPNVSVVTEAPRGLVVEADRGMFVQAVLNVALNGADAMEKGGQLTVRAEPRVSSDGAEQVAISISDEGTGMPPEIQARAFEPFFTTKPVGQGTGLGLPMVHGFVRGLGGFIDVQSRMGGGTTITLVVPRVLKAAATAESSAIPKLNRARALVVDDDDMVRRGLSRTLKQAGLDVTAASSGEEALRLLEGGSFDIIMTDVAMPGIDGPQLLTAVRETDAEIPVILFTGNPDRVQSDVKLDPRTRFVLKPLEAAVVVKEVEALLKTPNGAKGS